LKNPNLIVSLKTDLDAKYEDMVKVLDQLKLAEASRISLAVPEF
jgi:biopolymer transport protein ExbD